MKQFFFTLVCLIAGPIFAWNGMSDVFTALSAKNWPTVQGAVLTSNVETSRGSKGRRSYAPSITYRYEVDGKRYEGNRIDYGDRGSSSQGKAIAISMKYPQGRDVTVHYRKSAPEESVLEVGTSLSNWIVLVMGLIFTVVGIFSAKAIWREFNSNNYAPANGF